MGNLTLSQQIIGGIAIIITFIIAFYPTKDYPFLDDEKEKKSH
jgi:hypothetical protein